MDSVYLLQHLHVLPHGEEDVKVISVYSSRRAAIEAIERLRVQPGFVEYPKLIDPLVNDQSDGFYIDKYTLDQDHWVEGYMTDYPEEEEPGS